MFKKILHITLITCISIGGIMAQNNGNGNGNGNTQDTTNIAQNDSITDSQVIQPDAPIDLMRIIEPPPEGCVSSISPSSYNFTEAGGNINIAVTNISGCIWSASESLAWISTQKSGNTLIVTCQANSSTSSRSGTIIIKEKTFQVSQDGSVPAPAPGPSMIIQDQQCNVTYISPGTPPAGYEWWIQGSTCGTNKWVENNHFPIFTSGTYYIRAYQPSKNMWSKCTSFYVQVIGNPTINVSPLPAVLEMGQSLSLSASGASSYTWSPASTLSAPTGSSVTASPLVPTTYTVTGTNSVGCVGSKTINVDVTVPLPATPGKAYQCHSTLLTKGTAPTGVTWYWQSSNYGVSTANSAATYTVTSPGTYYLRARRNSDGRWSPTSTSFYVEVKGDPVISVSASPASIAIGQSSVLSASGASTYAWSPAGGLSAVSGSTVNASPVNSTDYTVIGTTSWGCSANKVIRLGVAIQANIARSQNNLSVNASGGNGAYTYLWNTGETTPTIEGDDDGTYSVAITDGFGQAKQASFDFVKTQDFNLNYVRTYVPFKDNMPTAAPDFENPDYTQWKVATSYFDGFGRSSQSVISKASPSGNDIVAFAEYDTLGRRSKSFLAYTAGPGDMPGAYRTKATTEQPAFYSNLFGQGNYAFSKTEFDGSPLNIPEKQYQAGQDWDGKFKALSFDGIGGFEVINWKVIGNSLVKSGTYSSNKLVKVEIQDEDGRLVTVYKDLQGRAILKKTTDGTNDVLTYSAYDEFGRLRYVLTPKAVPVLTGGSYSYNDAIIKDLCYYYEYSPRHLLVKKQLPGAEYISMEYDALDRPSKTQDAEQRLKGEKHFIEYDYLGRTYATGVEDSQGNKQYQSYSYYDNYNAFGPAYDFDATHAYHAKSTKVKGMPTGGKTRIMDWEPGSDMPEWLITVQYYDELGRPVQSVSNNHKKGIDISSTRYLYDGTVVETRSTHRVSEPAVKDDIVIKDKFEYDNNGYLIRQKEQLNNQAEIIVNQFDYYETGQLKSKKIHSADNGATFVQTVDYEYNIKGWLTKINNPASLGNDLFAMKFDYTQGPNKEYNGNIAAISWASATYTDVKTYTFAYDKLSRLSSAVFTGAQNRDYSMDVSYDLNGNITSLNRKGQLTDGSYGNIDNLVYTYKNGGLSNRLDRVDDANTTNNQNHGFSDLGAWVDGEYNYDDNGNMTEDKNRQITEITYNNMDLPVHITFAGATQTWMQNTYLAGGDKLRKENPDGKTDYIGSFIYENDELKYIQTGGGRIVVNGINFERQYYLTDHLGNVRVTFDTQGRILQEDSYYPFGMAQEGLNYVNNTLLDIENKNKYLYNGKEQDEQTKFFEYGFRDYDAQLGRWHVRDPMAESYASQSPYHFAGNNPVGNREINGAVYQSLERQDWERGVNESGVFRGSSSLDNAIGQADAYDAAVYDYSSNLTYVPGVGSVNKNDVINVSDSKDGRDYGSRTWDAKGKFWRTGLGRFIASLAGWKPGFTGGYFQRFMKEPSAYYGVDDYGNIQLYGDGNISTSYALLYPVYRDGCIKDESTYMRVYGKSVLRSLSGKGKTVTEVYGLDAETGSYQVDYQTLNFATSWSHREIMNLFVFLADNSSQAEWRLHKEKSGIFNISTLHERKTSASDGDLGVFTSQILWMIHSHPIPEPGHEVTGFDSDLGASFSYKGFYVYTPKSGYIWKFVQIGNAISLHRRQSNHLLSVFMKFVK